MFRSKPRGLRRKFRQMVRRIEAETELFPPRDVESYWHLHLPVARTFIDSQRTPFTTRRLCVQTLIDRAHHLSRVAPESEDIRVVVAVTLPELWASQIIVFFGPNYFDRFFERSGDEQQWVLIENRSLINEWQLKLPPEFQEQGYDETICEEELLFKSRIWFIGNL